MFVLRCSIQMCQADHKPGKSGKSGKSGVLMAFPLYGKL